MRQHGKGSNGSNEFECLHHIMGPMRMCGLVRGNESLWMKALRSPMLKLSLE